MYSVANHRRCLVREIPDMFADSAPVPLPTSIAVSRKTNSPYYFASIFIGLIKLTRDCIYTTPYKYDGLITNVGVYLNRRVQIAK
jgi:hypothetical protein